MIVGAEILALAIFAESIAAPADARPPAWVESETWVANVKRDPVRPVLVGPIRVELESTTLSEVRLGLGSGTSSRNGDASESLDWLCYRVDRAGRSEVIWLSSSEMGGGTYIDGVTAIDSGTVQPPNCPRLSSTRAPIKIENGLWLGSTEAQVARVYGAPRKTGDTWSYVFEGRRGKFDVNSNISFRMQGGKVVAVALSRVTSH